MARERATRRVRCKGPLCAKKRDEKQLHLPSEMVQIPGGGRYCVDCVKEAARLARVAEDEKYPPTQFEDTTPDEEHVWTPGETAELGEVLAPVDPEKVSIVTTAAEVQDDFERTTAPGWGEGGEYEVLTGTTTEFSTGGVPAEQFIPAAVTQPSVAVDLGDPLTYTRFPDVQVEGWPLRKGRLSASSIGTFVMCPEKFRQKEILGQREPSSGASIAGGAAHKGVEAYFRYMMMQGEPPPWEVWHEWLHAKFDYEVEREKGVIEWGKSTTGEKLPFTKDDVRGRAVQVAGTYIDRIAPHVQPVAVEDPFVVWVEGCPVPVVGSKDIVEAENIVDVKFGKAQANLDPGWRIQGLLYLLDGERDMTWHSVGWPKADGSCTFHTPLDAPALRLPRSYQNYSIAADIVRSSVESILAYAERFGPDNPWPGNLAHQWACDTCAYRKNGSCSWWHRNIRSEDLL